LKRILIWVMALLFLAAGVIHYLLFWPVKWEGAKGVVEVKQGEGAQVVAAHLKEAGIIRSASAFRWLARFTKADKKIKVGLYSFSSGTSLSEALKFMASPKAGVIVLTAPEGATIKKIAGLARNSLGVDSIAFVTLCQNRAFVHSLGVFASSLEGYLFPSSYEFYWGVPAREVIEKMYVGFKNAWSEIIDSAINPDTLNVAKILTMASLVETETGIDSERVLVSQVFHRRLKIGYPLQCDPTVIYALGETKRALGHDDLKFRSPYNTYLNYGLPPGPICNPGKAALKAALNPASTKYLYFVANGDGGHIFSETLDQHNREIYRLKKENQQ